MPGFLNFDPISFLLGFLIASFLWWAFPILKRSSPKYNSPLKQPAAVVRSRQMAGIDKFIYQHTYLKVQRYHLANSLFSLEEIVLPPKLLVPNYLTPDDETYPIASIASQIIPYLPDTPEMAAQYFTPTLSPAEALLDGANIVVIGEPGSGKTVALAYAVLQIINAVPFSSKLSNHLPVFIHISDLNLSKSNLIQPLEIIIDTITREQSALIRSRIPNGIVSAAKEGLLLILLDGLDELSRPQFDKSVIFIEALLKQYPKIQFMTTGSPNYLGGLIKLGFRPLAVAAWSSQEAELFVKKWNDLWIKWINAAPFEANALELLDPRILINWLTSQANYLTPLEWTLKCWSAYAADMNGPLAVNAIDNYISRLSGKKIPRVMLEHLALEFIRSNTNCLPIHQIDRFILNFSPPVANSNSTDKNEAVSLPIRQDVLAEDIVVAPKTTQLLIDSGLFIRCTHDQVRFANPLFPGFLSSFAIEDDQLPKIDHALDWSMAVSLLHYRVAQNRSLQWINDHIVEPQTPPLHRNIIIAGKWINDIPVTSQWRTDFMRKLLGLVTIDNLPYPVKARFMSLYAASNDQNISKLIKQLFSTTSVPLRFLAALTSGAIQDVKQKKELNTLLSDPSQEMRNAAGLAIGAMTQPSNVDPIVDLLMNGDEQIRQCAAETLAFFSGRGQDALKEAIEFDELMVRKAAVYGLVQVDAPWAMAILEKASYDDKQWIVRNAAHQALELIKKPKPYIPKPPLPPSEIPWMIESASKKGMGIVPGEIPHDLLISCLENGSIHEKIEALTYLVQIPDFEVVYAIYKLIDMGDPLLSQASINALWEISISGFSLPDYKV